MLWPSSGHAKACLRIVIVPVNTSSRRTNLCVSPFRTTIRERRPDHRTTVKSGFALLGDGETRAKPSARGFTAGLPCATRRRRSSTLMVTTSPKATSWPALKGTKTYVCVPHDAARGVCHAARSTNATERAVYIGRREGLSMSSARARASRTSATRPECTYTVT